MWADSEWQNETLRCAVVLREVFAWLEGKELARAGASCRAWRRAAAEPALWRRLLHRDLPVADAVCEPAVVAGRLWRQEYVSARAGWVSAGECASSGGAVLLHAALSTAHDALALCADDASLALWRRGAAGRWREWHRVELRTRGWSSCVRAEWARAAATRLLVTGRRALALDWELLVLEMVEDEAGAGVRVVSRACCSGGGAGCWVDAGDAFLSLELRLLAPGLACTTIWLNSATQETQSEHLGVTAVLLRIFNEGGAHITHALVVGAESDEARRLVAGSARGLASWRVRSARPPVLAGVAPGELAARASRHRAAAAAAARELRTAAAVEPPDEHSVRTACSPPDCECRLNAPLVGLELHDSARWLVAACADGSVWRVCARSLVPLARLAAPARGPAPVAAHHYVQPATSDTYVASPAGEWTAHVRTWTRQCGAPAGDVRGRRGEGAGAAVSVAALLPRAPPGQPCARATLLTAAGDTLYEWRSRATPQAGPRHDCDSVD